MTRIIFTDPLLPLTAQGSQWFQVRAFHIQRVATEHHNIATHPVASTTQCFRSQLTGHFANTLTSRQSLKKYVRANNTINVTEKMFDSLFNKALKNGVDKGAFEQPKGM
jgi:predicted nuclease with RNAse H fold